MKIKSMTEKECREFKVKTPKTKEELIEFIDSLDVLNNDYGTAAYAMSLAGTAAFSYIASRFGCTGFQASCADLDMLRRIRHIDGPFMIIKMEDYLYPQYNLHIKLDEMIEESKNWVKEKAEKNLKENKNNAHPNVIKHWEKLVEESK